MMRKFIIIAIVIGIAVVLFSGNDDMPKNTSNSAKKTLVSCKDDAKITGQQYHVNGFGIDVRHGPGINYDKVINQKATNIMKTTQHVSINADTVIFEECIKGEWSWIRVLQPDWLQNSHRGWVLTKFLDKEQTANDDPYARKISSYALMPYDTANYPKTVQKYGARLKEIEELRQKAAEMAADSGKCDFVELSELSSGKSTLEHLHFWVDCRNGVRIRLSEFEIKANQKILTQKEKAWDETSARIACRNAIKERTLIPSELDIHDIIGTSIHKAPITHNVVITMDFDAKNAFGVEFPYTAKCYFRPGEIGEIEIRER